MRFTLLRLITGVAVSCAGIYHPKMEAILNKFLRWTLITMAMALPFGLKAEEKPAGAEPVLRAPKGLQQPVQKLPPSNNWLQDADNDLDRFKRLEIYLRGFDQPMAEVGQRYQHLYQAIKDKNPDLAEYHWEKIILSINTGLMKRPKRTQNAEVLFLDTIYLPMSEAIKSKDLEKMQKQFMVVREACMACHIAENVSFMNNQPMFRDLMF